MVVTRIFEFISERMNFAPGLLFVGRQSLSPEATLVGYWLMCLLFSPQIRETEVIDPQDLLEGRYFSGDLPDDEDIGGPGQESDDFELSGSGDLDDSEDTRIFPEVMHPLVPIDNYIPEKTGSRVPTEPQELEENEVIPKRSSPFDGDEDVSNKVSMSSTAQGSNIFERTEVLAGSFELGWLPLRLLSPGTR
ncbi:hypothetical protein FD755_003881 [Muntiacus reevesi]|uniref:Uncharacterized protein n=1 Tax=Muntiacus reevesi TaxID=9886 RepID=A0A5J5MP13_MUNRE|nr:hypothetical protein FD755_003881 [Muntiacus reevesi]